MLGHINKQQNLTFKMHEQHVNTRPLKHVQHIGIISAFYLPGGDWLSFFVATGGDKKLLDCTLLGEISTQTQTMDIGAQKYSKIL